MPSTELFPNPAPPQGEKDPPRPGQQSSGQNGAQNGAQNGGQNAGQLDPTQPAPIRISTRRFGELDHSELVHLLDSLDDERSKARFRESIYISVIFYLLVMLLIIFGPRYIFHVGTIVPSAKERAAKDQLTQMELNRDLAHLTPPRLKPPPKLDQHTLERLQQMQRTNEAERHVPHAPAPAPLPPVTPPPQLATNRMAANQPPPLATPLAPLPRTAPAPSALPDAPLPSAPAAAPQQTIGQSMEQAAHNGAPRLNGRGIPSMPGARVGQQGGNSGVEILSDTQGVDFTDWLKKLHREIMASWVPLIPEEVMPPLNKEGWTTIRISVDPNGVVTAMHLDDSTHDRAIDKAAWGSITGVGQLPPLPKEYTGKDLELRMHFVITHDPAELQ